MKKILTKKTLIILATFIVILAALYGIAHVLWQNFCTSQNLKDLVTRQLSSMLERQVSSSEDFEFSLDWDLTPYVTLKDVSIGNAPWAKQGTMLKAAAISFSFHLLDLLHKSFSITALEITDLDLNLEDNGDQQNWQFNLHGSSDFKFSAESIVLHNAKISYQENDNAPNVLLIADMISKLAISKDHLRFKLHKFTSGDSDLHGEISANYNPLKISGEFKSHHFAPRDFLSTSTGDG